MGTSTGIGSIKQQVEIEVVEEWQFRIGQLALHKYSISNVTVPLPYSLSYKYLTSNEHSARLQQFDASGLLSLVSQRLHFCHEQLLLQCLGLQLTPSKKE